MGVSFKSVESSNIPFSFHQVKWDAIIERCLRPTFWFSNTSDWVSVSLDTEVAYVVGPSKFDYMDTAYPKLAATSRL